MADTTKGKHSNIELITGDPKKAINKLAWPMMLSMLLIMLYNLADSVWVSGLGADALAALGFITPLFMIIVGLGNGIGAGANSLIARAFGAKKDELANNAALHSVILTVIIGIVIPIILLPLIPQIIVIMGGASVTDLCMDYSVVTFGFLIVFLFSAVLSSILRSEGDVNRATIAIAITAVLNIVIDPIFIYTLNMGIAGAAWATVLSAGTSCLVMAYWIWVKKDTYMNLSFKHFNKNKKIVFEIMKVAIPSTAEQLIISVLTMCINAMLVIVSTTTAVAVYTASMRIVSLAMIPLIGIATALLTVAGAAYGARNYEKLKTSFTYSIKFGLLLSIILGALVFILAPQIALLFSYSASTAYLTSQIAFALRIFCFFLIFVPFGIAGSFVFQGVGKGTASLIITIIRSLFAEVVFAYLLGVILGYGEIGIFIGVIIGSFIGSMFGFAWAGLFIKKLKTKFSHTD